MFPIWDYRACFLVCTDSFTSVCLLVQSKSCQEGYSVPLLICMRHTMAVKEELAITSEEHAYWPRNQIEHLLHHYEKKVELWDVTNTNYSKKEARLRALQRVQETLDYNYTVKEINDKLKHLRSYYARELAKVNKSKKSGACTYIYRSKWAYFNTLDGFLRPQITPRKPVSILDSSLKESQQEDYDENDDEEELFGRETPQEPRPILPKKRRVTEHKDVVAGAVSVLSQLKTRNTAAIPPTVGNTQNEDDDLVFAKYLSTELRKVKKPRIKNNLKLKLQTLIFDAQMEDANV